MEFVLTGFHQDENVRQYTFQAIASDRTRTEVSVGADLGLIRKYNIPLQELPLLCKHLIEKQPDAKILMFTEQDMLGYAGVRDAAKEVADQKRKANRLAAANRAGQV